MSGSFEDEYEQVIDAFATDDAEIVHVIQNEDVEEPKYMETDKETHSDTADGRC